MICSISIPSILTILAFYITFILAQTSDPALVGTWTTKSKKVVTGPGFYDPVADKLIEPSLTGISYSFTADGWYEEAYYRAISNPQQPACPSAVMQWQHGRYTLPGNGSIVFEPIAVDGRQLTSRPCSYDSSLYVRYSQRELMIKYSVYTDPFHGVQRLDLYQFNGAPMHPMYLAYSPPQMLPTQTLNPTTSATGAAGATSTGKSQKLKREVEMEHIMGTLRIPRYNPEEEIQEEIDDGRVDRWYWAGLTMVGIGTIMYLLPTSRR